MQMPQHGDEAKAHFRTLVPDVPGVEVKPMFGSVGAFAARVSRHVWARRATIGPCRTIP